MTKIKKLSLILLIAAITVVLWFAISLPKSQVQPRNDKPTEAVNNATSTEPVVTATSTVENITAVATSTEGWLTYRNEEYGFEVKYPEEWEFKESNDGVVFGTTESRSGGYIWGIYIYNSKTNTEELIKELGSQFNDRLEKREKVRIDNKDGELVTVTTASHKDWISKSAFIKSNNFIFKIGNGAQDSNTFNVFLNSFKFLN